LNISPIGVAEYFCEAICPDLLCAAQAVADQGIKKAVANATALKHADGESQGVNSDLACKARLFVNLLPKDRAGAYQIE
jgi:hypothetical protein